MLYNSGNKQFWSRWSSRYDKFMRVDEPLYAEIAEHMKARLDRRMNVLELACGTGLISQRIAGRVRNLEATDYSPEMIQAARKKPHSVRLHYSVQDATDLPYGPETFDVVVITNALHIMPEPEKALREARRVLKKEGLLIAPTFVHHEGHGFRPHVRMMQMAGLKTYHQWDAQGFQAFVSRCGFTSTEVILMHGKSSPLCYLEAIPVECGTPFRLCGKRAPVFPDVSFSQAAQNLLMCW